ncbi:hypothetical protein BRADI_4g05745v3 [Brachypodium distachyon]|uniref:Uncharacterized protein n=1 Tax=Brachypodium distachyon TaxID=15368 RepID=A0A2K2CKP6_BRADI|nr:hypothetical protein BRADI_4g05745v3 [Brachypodium distachyon]PNT62602.1 hypothetical protein BRADI_4g05745v3 [Brachypodium distachyon]
MLQFFLVLSSSADITEEFFGLSLRFINSYDLLSHRASELLLRVSLKAIAT